MHFHAPAFHIHFQDYRGDIWKQQFVTFGIKHHKNVISTGLEYFADFSQVICFIKYLQAKELMMIIPAFRQRRKLFDCIENFEISQRLRFFAIVDALKTQEQQWVFLAHGDDDILLALGA